MNIALHLKISLLGFNFRLLSVAVQRGNKLRGVCPAVRRRAVNRTSKMRKEHFSGDHLERTYRSPKSLVTNLVMNLVTNLVITKLGEEFGDIFVTLFGDSPNWVMILVTFSSPNLVGHQIG